MIQEERTRNRPAPVGVLPAVRRYPAMVIVPMVLLAALGAALGYVRAPTYQATAQLAVGELNVSDPAAIGSVVQATESLASVYSRRIDATEVRKAISREVGNTSAAATVSATPVPDSPIVRVSAESADRDTAIRVANAGAEALTEHAQRLGEPAGGSESVFEEYREASVEASELQARVRELERRFGSNPSAADQETLNDAEADYETAKLRQEGLRLNYQSSQQTARSTPALSTFSLASAADSDRRQAMQVLLLLGLIAGAVIGAALATFRLNRRVARLTRP
jgi:hypothetical protein